MNRATVRYVNEHIYCSSTGHYAADVTLERGGKLSYYVYDFNGSLLQFGKRDWLETPCPKYLQAAILDYLRAIYTEGIVRVYEHNQDSERRYNNLRYHHAPHFENLIGLQQPAYLDVPTHCPTCSKPVDADTGFCTHCGER